MLDQVKGSGQVSEDDFEKVVGRISFFVNAGVRFVEETCKMRAFVQLWDEITRERYGVQDPKMRRFRYGVQVNSLGLTEAQPENNVQRIVLEMLGVTLSKNARARAVQLPAWNEALGLPRPWDQQWSLRLQQVLAFESDLLEYDDIFDGSHVIEAKVAELVAGAKAEIDRVQAMGGAIAAVESGYMKQSLVSAHAARRAPHRVRRGGHRRRQQVRDDRAVAADRRPRRRRSWPPTPRRSAPRARSVEAWKAERDEAEVDRGARGARRGRQDRREPDGSRPWPPPAPARRRGSGPARCARSSASSAAPTGVSGAVGVAEAGAELTARPRRGSGPPARSWAAGCGCSSASPGSTATPTAPSRSPYAPATRASR